MLLLFLVCMKMELLPDLHITRAGVLRIELGAHQEHRANHEARAADRTKVPAAVIQVAAHEMDADSNKAESGAATSDSEDSESASDSEQNDPPSSLASDAEQYERMQASYAAVGRDFYDQDDLIGSEYSKLQRTWACSWAMATGEAILLFAKMRWSSWSSLSRVLLGGLCNTCRSHWIAAFPSASV